MTNDVARLQSIAPVIPPVSRRRLARAFAFTVMLLGASMITLVAFIGPNLEAATCTLTSTAPSFNWTDTTKWSGCGGGFPGQLNPDTADVILGGGYTIFINSSIPSPVTLNQNCQPCVLEVQAGGVLPLASATAQSGQTFSIFSGGTVDLQSSGTFTHNGTFNLNGGTMSIGSGSSLTSGPSGGTFNISGGLIQGAGGSTVNIDDAGASLAFQGTVGTMTLDNVTVNAVTAGASTLTYSSSTNPLSLDNGAIIAIQSGSGMTISSLQPINMSGSGSINLAGTLTRSGGGSSTINATVNNDGTVSLTGSAATLRLAGGGGTAAPSTMVPGRRTCSSSPAATA